MRFILNMNVSRAVGEALAQMGQEWVHARDLGLATAEDRRKKPEPPVDGS
jgi:predicted nuclease of predicted toxin-antitoxin system